MPRKRHNARSRTKTLLFRDIGAKCTFTRNNVNTYSLRSPSTMDLLCAVGEWRDPRGWLKEASHG